MSYLNFEKAADKEQARQELREARAELLKKAEYNAKLRENREKQSSLRGDNVWMLPSISKKIDKMTEEVQVHSRNKKSKKDKKKKSKKEKHKKNKKKKYSSDSDSESSEEVKIIKRKRKAQSSESQSDSSDEEDSWVEKETQQKPVERDDWLSGSSLFTYTKDKSDKKVEERQSLDSYKPGLSSRELNPYWKNGGSGLPTFQKPNEDDDHRSNKTSYSKMMTSKGNWKKKNTEVKNSDERKVRRSRSRERRRRSRSKTLSKSPQRKSRSISKSRSRSESMEVDDVTQHEQPNKEANSTLRSNDFLTDQQMNELGAKLIKAEIMGNTEIMNELKEKLDRARIYRNSYVETKINERKKMDVQNKNVEHVLLTKTTRGGISRPLDSNEQWGGRKESRKKGKKVETHVDSERVRYFADDDKYDIKQMFEREKFSTGEDADSEFVKIASKHKNPNDDIEDIFSDKARNAVSDSKMHEKERNLAIREHQEITRSLESCDKCFDSAKMEKQLIVAMGRNVYLSLPSTEGLTIGHCLIIPMQHVSCSTQLDEDVWIEITDFRKALTLMFQARSQDVVFFETARYLHKRPHMVIHAIPSKEFELLPFYFKKAIQESEREWSHNKQLIDLKKEKKDLRRAIPKGLPYFWVNFGTDSGFAHVIEEQERFPSSFAMEIIGGLLNLDPRVWRRPRKEHKSIPKVKQFADWWKDFDITGD